MENKASIKYHAFDISDNTIHKLAATILLSSYDSEFIFTQGKYSYHIKGGDGGYLYYKKEPRSDWVLIAIWCFFGAYIVVRYRKPIWLRPMYESLFTKMHFTSITFDDYSIKLVGSEGEIMRSRKFRLSPPSAFDRVMKEKFNHSDEQIQLIKEELGLD